MEERTNTTQINDEIKDSERKEARSNRNSRRRNKKGSTKKRDVRKRALDKNERYNNPSWYFLSDEVKNQCSQLAFQDIMGLTSPLNDEVPNFVRFFVNPSPGVASPRFGSKSGFNQAMFTFYTQIAAFTGRAQSYAPQDIGMIILALGEIVSMFEYVRRFFGISAMTNERNYSYPKYAVAALGIDPDDFGKHRADYRDRFNFLLQRINALPIPGSIAYIEKCLRIYQNVFLDDPSSLATSMAFIPATTWKFNDAWYEEGSFLETISCALDYGPDHPSQGVYVQRNMEYYLNLIEAQLDALQTSSVWATVYSDILNYASKANLPLLKLDYLANDYFVQPSYNIEALLQIKHMSIMTSGNMATARPRTKPTGGLVYTTYNDVYPDLDSNTVAYNPLFHKDVDSKEHAFMLSLPTPNPDADMVLEATRFMASYGDDIVEDDTIVGNANCSLPDHWIVYAEFVGNDVNVLEYLSSNTLTFAEVSAAHVRALTKISCAPFLYLMEDGVPAGVIGDLAYFTEVPISWVNKLIKNVTMGLYIVR